ncbi:MAG: amino acid ABC transporter substrate-binding protein [Chitinophagaceae bacterium]
MRKQHFFSMLVLLSSLFQVINVEAQTNIRKHRVAVFAPLYLDSAFNEMGEYQYAKTEFPKFINPGIEFFEGVQLALDSLNKEQAPLEVFIYDTRSSKVSLTEQLAKTEMDSVEMILAYCSSNEVRTFADAGLKSTIPVININIPNEGGVSGNPYFVLLNPTLRTQCEGMYKHIQKYYSLDQLVFFRKKGPLEDRVKMYFDDFTKSTTAVPLKLQYVDLPENFTEADLSKHLDTVKHTLCIAGSLDENFGKKLAQKLASLKKKKFVASVMGMPTWDGISDFRKTEYKGIDIIYSTPFYNPRKDKISQRIIEHFNKVMYARPSDMVMRGYETMWKFGKLLLKYKADVASNISYQDFDVFREYDIQPILDRETMMLDYFENKKLYFLKWQDGILKGVY